MLENSYGGNILNTFDLFNIKEAILSTGPYEYQFHKVSTNKAVNIHGMASISVYILFKKSNSELTLNEEILNFMPGDVIQIENMNDISLKANHGEVGVLIAGSIVKSDNVSQEISIQKHEDLYKVIKPWGYELWISGNHPKYAFKEISIKAGTKTSLQYHQYKKETNFLLKGEANLHYLANPSVPNDLVTPKDIQIHQLKSNTSIDVEPNTLHRIEAITDILLFEVSTPHLDDVIRVIDDAKRADGKIESEHSKK